VPHTLIEIWQANAAGPIRAQGRQWKAPLDPNFTGAGRTLTDAEGRYTFTTIRPGAYPWRNHQNAWRPAHIHFSLFGQAFATRLVTQMYFPGIRCSR
jgi:protocatechuate 3,4-dioxygenase beta subunit